MVCRHPIVESSRQLGFHHSFFGAAFCFFPARHIFQSHDWALMVTGFSLS
jgi:hypothetical protein